MKPHHLLTFLLVTLLPGVYAQETFRRVSFRDIWEEEFGKESL